jgi:hypothetical protein
MSFLIGPSQIIIFEILEIPQYVNVVQIENHSYILVLGKYLNFQRIINFWFFFIF